MSRSKRDKRGGHRFVRYNKEDPWVKALFRRKRRQEGKRFVEDYENEGKEPNPPKSTGGWISW